MKINEVIDFIIEIDKLKSIIRKTLIYSGERKENSAEHSWHLAMSTILLKDFSNYKNLDLNKCIKIALIHDLVEIYAGDTFVYAVNEETYKKELEAANELFEKIPNEVLKLEFLNLWKEFELLETPEAKYVKAIDRFLPFISNSLNNGFSWKQHNITEKQIRETNQHHISNGIPDLWKFTETLIAKAKDEKLIS